MSEEPALHYLNAADGTQIAVHMLGDKSARPLVMIHGLASSAEVNWIKYGTARRLAEAGFRCIMPDLRGHGHSDAPEAASAYPPDVIAADNAAIIAALGLTDYDLCGFSLGARTAAKLVIDGARPRRLILAGMGYEGFTDWSRRRDYFLDLIARADILQRGDPGFLAVAFMRTTGMSLPVIGHVVSSVGDMDPERLEDITPPTLILCGADDRDNGDPDRLADALPDGHRATIPGNHMNCVTRPEFGRAIADFLTA